MYSYKLNNSYTVYVNYIYLNECIKAGKKSVQKEDRRSQSDGWLTRLEREVKEKWLQDLQANS